MPMVLTEISAIATEPKTVSQEVWNARATSVQLRRLAQVENLSQHILGRDVIAAGLTSGGE